MRPPIRLTRVVVRLAMIAWTGLWGVALGQDGLEQVPGPGPIRVSEVVSWNDEGLEDRSGRSPDWIELTNTSARRVSLVGYGLSDDRDEPMKWRFPSGSLAPGELVVIFASGRGEFSSGSEFHVGFKVGASGDVILVTRPDGERSDSVNVLPATLPDVSQGRLAGDPARWRFFSEPTPGRRNPGAGFVGIAEPVVFSHEAGYFAEPFALTISGSAGNQLRYTLNGDEPSELATLYSDPLEVYDRSGDANGISMIDGTSIANQHTDGWYPPRGLVAKAFSVRARAFGEGLLPGPIGTRTYFVGLNPATRWGLPVIALSSPPAGLFDYEKGIYMLGKVFDDYRAANPGVPLTGHTRANYTQRGSEWARAGHFEFFEADGSVGVRQNIRLDIQGQSSRSFRQKSFGLKPRGDTKPADAFDYPFFPALQRRGTGGRREKFAGLRLRNSGNDWDYTMMRDALGHRLVAPLGTDVMTSRPVAVFLNGEFWGLYNLREQGDLESVEAHYGVGEEGLVMAERDGRVKEGDRQGASSYAELRDLVEENDLSDPGVFAEVEGLMDPDNFLRYQLAEIYLGNADWPHNNVRYWRGPDPVGGPAAAKPGFDGRWRWMLFDTDLAYAHPWSGGAGDATLAAATNPTGRPGLNAPWSTALLRGLLGNPGFRADFINSMACYLNSVFGTARAQSTIDEMEETIEPVMSDQILRWRTSDNSLRSWSRNVGVLKGFARQRPPLLFREFTREFGLSGRGEVEVNVVPARAGIATIHRLRLDTGTAGIEAPVYPWSGEFFRDVPITLNAAARPGYVFRKWEGHADGEAARDVVLSGDAEFSAHFERVQTAVPLAATGEYRFESWSEGSSAGSYPDSMRLEQTGAAATADQAGALMDSVWTGRYNLSDRSRFVGLDGEGLGIRDTGRLAEFAGSGFPGAVVVALDTTGLSEVSVAWTAGTVRAGEGGARLSLQLAIGDGEYADFTDGLGNPIGYDGERVPGEMRFAPVVLPAAALDQPYVELRWRYFFPEGRRGSGPLIRLDDIVVTGVRSTGRGEIADVRWEPAGMLALSFRGVANSEYLVQWSGDLENWQEGEAFSTGGSGGADLELIPPQTGMRFVRVARRK